MHKTLAAALLLAASAGGAFAIDGTSMLGIAAEREARELGIHIDAAALTTTQLALINAVTASSDYSRNDKERQVRAIVGF